jgi:ABC-type nitrate/sulfonate/bicarbonate transport system substrate-binding protein
MKTIFIDIAENRKELSGFLLTHGYNFRQVDFVQGSISSKVLVVEAGNKKEEKALKAFIQAAKASVCLVVEKSGKAGLKGKKLGTFQEGKFLGGYYLDKTTGKTYGVV